MKYLIKIVYLKFIKNGLNIKKFPFHDFRITKTYINKHISYSYNIKNKENFMIYYVFIVIFFNIYSKMPFF
jgi:hypothetical protein